MVRSSPTLALALQGGGSHGAFTWGVLDRLLQEVATDNLRISAISGSSAGAINGALTVSGLVQGGPELARRKLADFWQALSRRGFFAGNAFLYGEPGSFGINIDWSPIAIAMEARPRGWTMPLAASVAISWCKRQLTLASGCWSELGCGSSAFRILCSGAFSRCCCVSCPTLGRSSPQCSRPLSPLRSTLDGPCCSGRVRSSSQSSRFSGRLSSHFSTAIAPAYPPLQSLCLPPSGHGFGDQWDFCFRPR
jgi:hypothetical protein